MSDEPPSYHCPKCNLPLTRVGTSMGVFWTCSNCGGRAVTVELLRRTFKPDSINPLWRHAISGQEPPAARACPSCRRAMLEVPLSDKSTVRVDVCRLCHFVWFDAHETETLVPLSVPPKKPSAIPNTLDPDAFSDPWLPDAWWSHIIRALPSSGLPGFLS
jgi:Zn-finger nucleic acid-binding protein